MLVLSFLLLYHGNLLPQSAGRESPIAILRGPISADWVDHSGRLLYHLNILHTKSIEFVSPKIRNQKSPLLYSRVDSNVELASGRFSYAWYRVYQSSSCMSFPVLVCLFRFDK